MLGKITRLGYLVLATVDNADWQNVGYKICTLFVTLIGGNSVTYHLILHKRFHYYLSYLFNTFCVVLIVRSTI